MKYLSREKLAMTIEKRALEDIAACNIGGASVLVAQDGDVVYKRHFSSTDMPGDAVSDRTLFRLASMTKPITAVAAMILTDRGLLSPEDTVDQFYGKFSSMKLFGSETEVPTKITIEHLLTHTSGLGSGRRSPYPRWLHRQRRRLGGNAQANDSLRSCRRGELCGFSRRSAPRLYPRD